MDTNDNNQTRSVDIEEVWPIDEEPLGTTGKPLKKVQFAPSVLNIYAYFAASTVPDLLIYDDDDPSTDEESDIDIQLVSIEPSKATGEGLTSDNLRLSPVPHLLQSNYRPTEEEIRLIEGAISTAKKQRLKLNETVISQPSLDHTSLIEQLDGYSTFVLQHTALLSSIRHIPPELLQEIFMYLAPEEADPEGNIATVSYADLPFNISQVCGLWRAISLSNSILWKRLPSINLNLERGFREAEYLQHINELLLRSANCPLDIHVFGCFVQTLLCHPVVDILVSHCARWRNVMIYTDFESLQLFNASKGRLSSLRELTIRLDPEAGRTNELIDWFSDAPQLRILGLSGPWYGHFVLPPSNIERYWMNGMGVHILNQALDSAPTLKTLIIDGGYFEFTQIATLPQLTFLKIDNIYHIDHMLDCLTLPRLEQIYLGCGLAGDETFGSIISLVERSNQVFSSRLNKIYIETWTLESGNLTRLIRETPLITYLHVTLPPIEDLINLSVFHPGSGGGVVAPRLEVCEFTTFQPIPFDSIQHLNDLARFRCDPSLELRDNLGFRPLKTLYIHSNYNNVPEVQQLDLQKSLWQSARDRESTLRLKELSKMLSDHVPQLAEIEPHYTISFWGGSPPDESEDPTPHDAQAVLSALEGLEITDASEIWVSGTQYLINCLRFMLPSEDPRHELSLAAEKIWVKWIPIFEKSLGTFVWAIQSPTESLMYIPQDHALRSSPDALKMMTRIYLSDLSPQERSWPSNHRMNTTRI